MTIFQTGQVVETTHQRCTSETNPPRMLLVAGVLVVCAALAIVMFIGLAKTTQTSPTSQLVGQEDPYSIGCYADDRFSRVMPYVYTDGALTPFICNYYCEERGYFYYGLQSGVECWCGHEDVEIDKHGTGICDYPCEGDINSICGGYLAFTAYAVGSKTSSVGETSAESTTVCSGTVASVRFASSSGNAYFEDGGCATLTVMYNKQTGSGPLYTLDDNDNDYFEDGGCATLTVMYNEQTGSGPLYILDDDDNIVDGGGGTPTGRWLLTMNLLVVDDVTLYIHSTSVGGDCDVLRIGSTDDNYYEIRGHGGSLSFKETTVTSWDTNSGSERTQNSSGRSFIRCISEETSDDTCGGAASHDMGECRMDIIDSTMGNLGFNASESYGLTWKVRGYCDDESNPEVFERTGVYGDIQGSEIYGMYHGVYTYGHGGGVWTGNVVHDNIQYGFDPNDNSDHMIIANNEIYGNGNHGIIASKRSNKLKIYGNDVYDGGDEAVGIFLYRSCDDAIVYDNYIHHMQNAGVALMESMDATIYNNTVEDVRSCVRISVGAARNAIYGNTFDNCFDFGFHTYQGSDDPYISDGRPSENVITGNIVSNTTTGVYIKEGDSNKFIGNDFTGAELFKFNDTTNTYWSGNTIGDGCMEGSSTFASGSDDIPSC